MSGIKRSLPTNQHLAAINANNPSSVNPFATIADVTGINIVSVSNYSALPNPTIVPNKFYRTIAGENTSWRPTWLGGTYYPEGIYFSDGTSWDFVGEFPYQATQAEVDAGTNDKNFVTPATLWGTKIRKHYGNLDQTAISALVGMSVGDTVYNTTLGRTQEYNSGTGWNTMNIRTLDFSSYTTLQFTAPYNMKILSITNITNSPTTSILVGASSYTLGTLISVGSSITITVSTNSVINLNEVVL